MIKSALAATARLLRQDAGYAGAFVLTLGLGIGATTAIFSAVEGVLIRPLPYPHADRIVYVQQPLERAGDDNTLFSFVEASDYRTQATTLEEVVEYGDWQFNVVGLGEPRVAFGGLVTSNYFKVLAIRPYLGRVLQPSDDGRGTAPVAVLTYEFWQRVTGADPGVINRADRADRRGGDDRRRARTGIALRRDGARGAVRELSDQRALHERVDAERAYRTA